MAYLIWRLRAALAAIIRRPRASQPGPSLPLAALTAAPVPELGDWDADSVAALTADPDPLDTAVPLLTGQDMVPAYTFADLMALRPVALDYPEISFTQEWLAAGERLANLGDTQPFEAIQR